MSARQIILLAAVVGAGVFGWQEYRQRNATHGWLGYGEADYVRVAPTALGRLTARLVKRGDSVKRGDLLFTLDAINETAARDQAAAALAQEREKLSDMQNAGRAPEIAAANADVADSEAALDRATRDLKRAEALVGRGDISQQATDQARADKLSAEAHLAASKARMSLILASNAREHAIAAETNAVEAAGKALAQAQWRLDERVVNAPASGIVADTFAEPGETVNAGASVVEILPPENILVRFFVPEAELVGVHVGDGVKVTCDSCPTDLTAKISFVATQSEYAPPVIYAQGTRGALVYLIEARPEPARATLLKPGQPVEVFPLGTRTP